MVPPSPSGLHVFFVRAHTVLNFNLAQEKKHSSVAEQASFSGVDQSRSVWKEYDFVSQPEFDEPCAAYVVEDYCTSRISLEFSREKTVCSEKSHTTAPGPPPTSPTEHLDFRR